MLDPVDDTYRRQMGKQLSVQESRQTLARDICHGKKGTIHQAYRQGMEDQLGSLSHVLNAVILWTTKYIDAAVPQLRAEGHEIKDVARLSPLKHKNLNVLGSLAGLTVLLILLSRVPEGVLEKAQFGALRLGAREMEWTLPRSSSRSAVMRSSSVESSLTMCA